MKVDFGKSFDDFEQQTFFDHEFDFFFEFKPLQDGFDAGGIGGDELQKVGVDIVAVAHQRLKCDAFFVVEGNAAFFLNGLLHQFFIHVQLVELVENLADFFIFICQYAVKPAQNRHRNYHVAVLFGGIGPTEFIGNFGDQVYFGVDIDLIHHFLFPFKQL